MQHIVPISRNEIPMIGAGVDFASAARRLNIRRALLRRAIGAGGLVISWPWRF